MTEVNIIVADAQYLTRAGFLHLFGAHPGLHVVAEADDAEELMAQVKAHRPDLVVLDYHRTDHFALDDIRHIRERHPQTKFLVVTDDDTKTNIFKALESGVGSILTKNCSRDEIIAAVLATARGEKFFCNKVLDIILEKHIAPLVEEEEDCSPSSLSAREVEVVALIAQGVPTRDIADRLCLSPHTVYTHRKNIMKKLHINSVSELVLYAVNAGIVKMGEN